MVDMTKEDKFRASCIVRSVCPICRQRCGAPDNAAMCCEGEQW